MIDSKYILTTLCCCVSILGSALTAEAQSYPSRPVRLVVPFAPGGTVDIVARIIGARISSDTGHQVVVDNRGGGGGVIGTDIAAKSRSDGYTLLIHSAAIAYEPALRENLPYNVLKDFEPLTMIGSTPNLLVVHPSFAPKSARDLIALAKEKPGAITFGTGGIGSSSHLAVVLFQSLSGISLNHVAYKGAGPALVEVVAGQINFMVATMPGAISQVKAGRLRALGISSSSRSPVLPNVPAIAESGLPGYEFVAWFGMLAPAGTSAKLVNQLNTLIRDATNSQDTQSKLDAQGITAKTGSPSDFRSYIRSETDKWAKILKNAGIKAQ
jgi:tripartite-type tricarboxylate transporter receptor subunit TctC